MYTGRRGRSGKATPYPGIPLCLTEYSYADRIL
jgi:hypothetical protein